MEAFLSAVRNDFRVLWKGLERVARGHGTEILVANMDRVLDTVESYVSSIQQAFSEEEALLAQNLCDVDNSKGQNNTANQNNGQDGGGLCGGGGGGIGS